MRTICFFSGDITRNGGTERIATMIVNRLAEQGKDRFVFLSLTEQEKQPFFPIDASVERYALGDRWISPGPGYLPVIGKLRKFLKQQKIDIIVDIDIVLDSLSIPAARRLGTKVVSWGHFSYEYEQSSFYRRWILKYAISKAYRLVTLTYENKVRMEKHAKRANVIHVIRNPILEQSRIPADQRERMLISVGRLIPRKGIDYLAQVAKTVLGCHPDWKWYVLGEGEERAFLEKEMEAAGLADRLILTGNVTNVEDYLQRASIYVMTSRAEGLPMVLLEAKACCLPCVSFSINGTRELIDDGVNGYLIPAFDCDDMSRKIETLMEDVSLRADFAKNAGRGMEEFQPEYVLKQWEDLFADVVPA